MPEALRASGLSNECLVYLSNMPFVQPYLEKLLLEHRTTGLVVLHTIHKAAEQLAAEDGDAAKFEEYALSLLQLVCTTGKRTISVLLGSGPGSGELSGFDQELLTAAAYTNSFSLVKKFTSYLKYRPTGRGVLGNPCESALLGRHFHILNFLLQVPERLPDIYNRALLKKEAENNDKEMVEFIL